LNTNERRPVILIVEDEFLVRMDAVDMIRAAGFDVVEAADADEAIVILEDRLITGALRELTGSAR
jgi:two-component system, response regulator PdtaR